MLGRVRVVVFSEFGTLLVASRKPARGNTSIKVVRFARKQIPPKPPPQKLRGDKKIFYENRERGSGKLVRASVNKSVRVVTAPRLARTATLQHAFGKMFGVFRN